MITEPLDIVTLPESITEEVLAYLDAPIPERRTALEDRALIVDRIQEAVPILRGKMFDLQADSKVTVSARITRMNLEPAPNFVPFPEYLMADLMRLLLKDDYNDPSPRVAAYRLWKFVEQAVPASRARRASIVTAGSNRVFIQIQED